MSFTAAKARVYYLERFGWKVVPPIHAAPACVLTFMLRVGATPLTAERHGKEDASVIDLLKDATDSMHVGTSIT